MAAKRKRTESVPNQENATHRKLRSGKTSISPTKVLPSSKLSTSRSPRKPALKETSDVRQDDEDRIDPVTPDRDTRESTKTKRSRKPRNSSVEREEVAQLLEQSPSKKRKRNTKGDSIRDEPSPNVDEASSSTLVAEEDSVTEIQTPSRRTSKRQKSSRVGLEAEISVLSKSSTPVAHHPSKASLEQPQPRSPSPLLPSIQGPQSLDLSSYLNAQKRAILQALQQPRTFSGSENSEATPTQEIAHQQLRDLLLGTVTRGEGNSCLLLGPRGSGKSMLVDQILSSLDSKPIILRLSGWVQTSDKLALREIALQLLQQTGSSFLTDEDDPSSTEKPAAVDEDDENPFLIRNEGPSTQTIEQPMRLPPSSQLHALIPVLLTLGRPVVAILDAFDMFALHPRQSLLYCLLDTVQSCHMTPQNRGIAVIGVTTRVDTIQLLEKRVKSRFSGRSIRMAPPGALDDWISLARDVLQIPISLDETLEMDDWRTKWNESVDAFLGDIEVISVFNETFSISKDVKLLQRLLVKAVLQLHPSEPFLVSKHILSSVQTQRTRPSSLHVTNLSYPTMCLLIASVHADTAGHPTFTFEMLFENFRDQLRASTSAPVQVNGGHIGMVKCTREVLLTAYEHLKACKIFVPTVPPSSSLAREYVRHRTNLDREVVKRLVEKSGQVHLKKWLLKS